MDGLDAETAGQAREIMSRQVDHLVRLVDDLLDVSRIMRGKIELKKEPVEARAIVSRAVETAQPLIQSQRHELKVSLPPEPVWVHADVVRMAQVISNLLNNSAKYTPQGGTIWLSVERAAGGVRFRVRDTGVGIDRELLPRVFDLFTQASRSIARSQGGLGIGLTLVRNLVEMHDGTVSATSAGPGQGAEFTVSLPALEQSPEPPAEEWKPQPTRELKVLVVEDMVGSARILSAMLQKFWNHSVMMVHDGLDALHAAKSFHPDVVLLDIGLPGISGFDVARRLRQEPETRHTLLVALTGYGTAEDRQMSEDAGFDEHLVKPASVHSLQKLFTHPRLAE
jgi:CheY-like chemotaxis protein